MLKHKTAERDMELKDKIILALGDSITAAHRYIVHLKELSGAKEIVNYGIGGTTIAKRKKLFGNEYDKDFIGRVSKMQENADVILVFGGTNDYGHGDVPIGNENDTGEDTFCGCVNKLIHLLKEKYASSTIFFISPLPRVGQDNPFGENGRKSEPFGTLEDYVKALKSVVAKNDLPILDLFVDEDFQLENPKFQEYINADGLHPNAIGHKMIAQKIWNFLQVLN